MPDAEPVTQKWLDRIPELEDGKRFPGMDPVEAAKLFDEILAANAEAITSLVDAIQEVDDGKDWKTRYLLHALGSHVGSADRGEHRSQLEAAYLSEIRADRPASVKTFLIQQLLGFATAESVPALVKQLDSGDRHLIDAAAAALTAIGESASNALLKARGDLDDHAKTAVDHALLQIG